MVILDTNIIIDHLRRADETETALLRVARVVPKEQLALSVLSVQELYEGRSTRENMAEALLLATITPLRILPYTYEIAEVSGKIARDLSRPIELADTAIAGTALVHGAELYTLNKKDFQGIPSLEFWTE